ncbi:hypothetical protein DL546_008426 [Coniochaeta pulveracea]|uniref:Zn(2)-C6 fungal-type domain-containing protein n=1 Tax=Coniochaeta pulveracea TaxID=177199 RepID=A0A420YMQ2_9PEZI|nr:hypothetical protein DL546_008426 [Coniochaeta pulveracea]
MHQANAASVLSPHQGWNTHDQGHDSNLISVSASAPAPAPTPANTARPGNTMGTAVAVDDQSQAALASGDEYSSDEERAGTTTAPGPPRKRKLNGPAQQKTSCELCKTRKVKCDRAEPSCGWCARHGRECVYKERRNNQHRTDQIMELEGKVKRLEALLQALGRRVEEHVLNDHATGAIGFPPRSEPSPHQSLDSPRPGTMSTVTVAGNKPAPALSQSFWEQRFIAQQSLRTPDHELPDHNRTSVQSLLNNNNNNHNYAGSEAAVRSAVGAPSASSLVPEVSESNNLGEDLPPNDVLYTLVDLFFKHTNTWIPILDRKTTFATFFGSTSLTEADRIVLYAIVACTLRFSKDPRLTPELKRHYHESAKRRVELYAFENVNIEASRALVILLVDVLGTSNGPRGWNLLALIVQNAKQLGLFAETKVYLAPGPGCVPETGSLRMVAIAQPRSFIEDEGRRRLAWVIYQLDRYATIATTTFDFMLHDKDMNRHLPCSYDLFSKNVPVETCPCPSWEALHDLGGSSAFPLLHGRHDNLGSFSHHCQILRILSGIHDFLKTPLDITSAAAITKWRNTHQTLDAALNTWLQNLPGEYSRVSALCHSDPASRVANWFMLHSVFVTSAVRLHSAAAYPITSILRSPVVGQQQQHQQQHQQPKQQDQVQQGGTAAIGGGQMSNGVDSDFSPSYHAVRSCLSAVNSLCDIVRDVREVDGLDLLGPPFAFSLWMAARVLIVHAAATGSAVDPKVDFFIETLAHVGRFWEVAGNYAKILTRVVQKGRDGLVSFSDMRRSAYALVTTTASTRRSGLEPTSTRVTSLEEIDYIDVFDFFNVPKVKDSPIAQAQTRVYSTGPPDPSVEAVAGGIGHQAMGMTGGNMTGLTSGPEWMGY